MGFQENAIGLEAGDVCDPLVAWQRRFSYLLKVLEGADMSGKHEERNMTF